MRRLKALINKDQEASLKEARDKLRAAEQKLAASAQNAAELLRSHALVEDRA
jgi:hypothetical protein